MLPVWETKLGNVVYRIPAATVEEAEAFLEKWLGYWALPRRLRWVETRPDDDKA